METIKKKLTDLPLRKFFTLIILITVCTVVILSGLIIWGCTALKNYLLPDTNSIYLTVERVFEDGSISTSRHLIKFDEGMQTLPYASTSENGNEIYDSKYSIQKIEKSYDTLSPKRKIVYQGCNVLMVTVPSLLSVFGILFCGFYFYKRKLSEPLRILSNATGQIAIQNLDFSIQYGSTDEMGLLCASFEQMRAALAQNNKAMWELLEQRKLLQASIAHDLRNPIAIIEGYTEYLKLNLLSGKMNTKKVERILNNLNMAAKRLEHYTESVRTLNQLEDMETDRKPVLSAKLTEDIRDDFEIMASDAGISLCINNFLPECKLQIDAAILYRILENIFGNALSYARHSVIIDFRLDGGKLHITVTDDGKGFSHTVLRKKEALFLPTGQEDGHLGMGLAISRLLCEKHGGSLNFYNNNLNNAVVEIIIAV